MKRNFGVIKNGWEDAGKSFRILGSAIQVNGMYWTPIIFESEEDPTFIKTESIQYTDNIN